jgi:invasion protein IalB
VKFTSRFFAFFLLLIFSSFAQAQDAAKAPTAPPSNIKTFGNWTVVCPPADNTSAVRCAAQFTLVDKKRKLAVIVWRIGFNKQQKLGMDLVTPTEVFIAKGVKLAIGKTPAITLPYVSCGLQGCQSATPIDANLLTVLKGANSATLSLAATNGKTLQLKLAINGLNEALAAVVGP